MLEGCVLVCMKMVTGCACLHENLWCRCLGENIWGSMKSLCGSMMYSVSRSIKILLRSRLVRMCMFMCVEYMSVQCEIFHQK